VKPVSSCPKTPGRFEAHPVRPVHSAGVVHPDVSRAVSRRVSDLGAPRQASRPRGPPSRSGGRRSATSNAAAPAKAPTGDLDALVTAPSQARCSRPTTSSPSLAWVQLCPDLTPQPRCSELMDVNTGSRRASCRRHPGPARSARTQSAQSPSVPVRHPRWLHSGNRPDPRRTSVTLTSRSQ
jgi:hypothetical protein